MNDKELLQSKLERMRQDHVNRKFAEILQLMLKRIEAIEEHLWEKFGELP
jgi:hypothetical protein